MLRRVLWALGLLVLGVAAVVAVAVLNLERLVNEFRDELAAEVGEVLGRDVVFGPVRLAFVEGLSAEFTTATLAGREPTDPPQAEVHAVFFRLDVWKMVETRGARLEFSKVTVNDPVIHLRRNADGTWDFDDILKRVGSKAEAQTAAAPKDLEQANAWLQGLEIAGVAVNNGTIAINDGMRNRRLVVDRVHADVSRIIPGHDVSATLKLVLDDDRTRAPMRAELSLRPLPANLSFDDIPNTAALVEVKGVNLGTWGDLVPEEFTRPEAGQLNISIKASTDGATRLGHLEGAIGLTGLELGLHGKRGESSDLGLQVDADANLITQQVTVRKLDISGPGLSLNTQLMLKDRTLQGIQDVKVDLKVADLARLTSVVPQGSSLLPKELRLKGPFSVEVRGDANNGRVVVDLDNAHVAWADDVNKTAGVPLRLDATAQRDDKGINFSSIRLQLQQAVVQGTLHVPERKGAALTGELQTGDVVLSQLEKVFPAAVAAQGKGQRLDGVVRLHAVAKEQHRQQALRAELDMKRMDVSLPRVTVKGDGSATVDMAPQAKESALWTVDARFTDLAVRYTDVEGRDLVNKPRGLSSEVRLVGTREGPNIKMDDADLKFGRTVASLKGAWTNRGADDEALVVKTDQLDVLFDDVRAVAPRASLLPPGGTLHARVAVRQDPSTGQALHVDVEDLLVVVGRSRVAGVVLVRDPSKLVVTGDLQTVDLDLTELRALLSRPEIPDGTLRTSAKGTYDSLHNDKCKVELEGLDATVLGARWQGVVRFKNPDAPNVDATLQVDQVNVDTLRRRFASPSEEKATPRENPHGLSRSQRAQLQKVEAAVALKAGSVTYDKYRFDDVDVVLRASNGNVWLERLDWRIYAGQLSATGTRVETGTEHLKSRVVLKSRHLDVGRAVDAHAEKPGKVQGKLDADIDLTASGMTWDDIKQSVRGPIALQSDKLSVRGLNFLGAVVEKVREMVPLPNVRSDVLDPEKPTDFRKIDVRAGMADGKLTFTKPMTAGTDFGELVVEGNVGLDSQLALEGGANMQPDAIGSAVGLKPPKAVLIPVTIGGTWSDPKITGVNVEGFMNEIGFGAVVGKAKEQAERARAEMEKRAGDAKAKADEAKAAVEARAGEAKAKADEAKAAMEARAGEAKAKADEAKANVEAKANEAKAKADEAKANVEAKANEAKAKADEAKANMEAKADEAKAKADEAKADMEAKAKEAKAKADKAKEDMERRAREAKEKAEGLMKDLFSPP